LDPSIRTYKTTREINAQPKLAAASEDTSMADLEQLSFRNLPYRDDTSLDMVQHRESRLYFAIAKPGGCDCVNGGLSAEGMTVGTGSWLDC
jgi:hypothetical protein